MNKIKSREKIIKLLEDNIEKNKPYGYIFSFKEIVDYFSKEHNHPYQSVAKLLKRLERDFAIVYLKLTIPRMDTKDLLREIYLQRKWPTNSGRVYLYFPLTRKIYYKLTRRYNDKNNNKELIREICLFYRQIEMATIFQYMYATKEGFISESNKAYMGRDINEFYKEGHDRIKIHLTFSDDHFSEEKKKYYEEKWQKFLKKNIFFDKYMLWISFFENKKHPDYDPAKSFYKNVTQPMYGKLMILFSRIIDNPKLSKNI